MKLDKWGKFTSTGDDTKPEVKKTKAMDDEIRVDVYDKNYTYYSDWTLTEPDTVSTKKQAKD